MACPTCRAPGEGETGSWSARRQVSCGYVCVDTRQHNWGMFLLRVCTLEALFKKVKYNHIV